MLNSLIGIIASSGGVAGAANSYESIATVTVTSATNSISFTSIPSTYQHLQVRAIGRNSNAGGNAARNSSIQFNTDTGSNYAIHYVAGNGSSAFTDADYNINQPYPFAFPDDNTTANAFGVAIFDILDYANTNKNKTLRSLTGSDVNGSGTVRLNSALWLNTAAITSIRFFTYNSVGNFVAGTQFALYGIKG
jgi:hypothetical protein